MSLPRTLELELTTLREMFEVTELSLGAVTRTPDRPDFHAGHAIHLHQPPAGLDQLLATWQQHLAGLTGIRRFVAMWLAPVTYQLPPGVSARAADLGLELDRSDVMELGVLVAPPSLARIAPKEAGSDTDWACIGVLQRWMSEEGEPAFWRWMAATGFRAAAEAGHATAWLVHRHGEPACSVVVGHDGDATSYIGSVVTHPAHRGHGLASALVHHACEVQRWRRPGDTILLAADPGEPAQRVYERLGFATTDGWWELTGDADEVRDRLVATNATGAAG